MGYIDTTRPILRTHAGTTRCFTFMGPYLIPLPRVPYLAEIRRETARHYRLTDAELLSPSRKWRVAHPRQVAMYLSRRLAFRSLPEIGRHYRRDHTTVIQAIRRVNRDLLLDMDLRRDVDALVERLNR